MKFNHKHNSLYNPADHSPDFHCSQGMGIDLMPKLNQKRRRHFTMPMDAGSLQATHRLIPPFQAIHAFVS